MNKTVVLNVVGLTSSLIGARTPRISAFRQKHGLTTIGPVLPAVTCSVQSTYLTGTWPTEHGIVGNGWYSRDDCEVKFWKQSNKLVQRPKVWDMARQRNRAFTCANLFWWYNMYSTADYSVTPRPMYPADGRKIPDIYTHPATLREDLRTSLGEFPLFQFWGPATSIKSTQWIAQSAMHVEKQFDPTLTLIYLPHLDYDLQRVGPDQPQIENALREVDQIVGMLIDYYQSREADVIILSEYGITPVRRPVHLNRVLRKAGLLKIRDEMGHELLDAGASSAFAVADHQVAHVYVNDPAKAQATHELLSKTPGVARVLDDAGKKQMHLNHPRSGDFVVLADPDAWFTYYYWFDESRAPDFAPTVDIHRKPGYDPAELFIDPAIQRPKLKLATKLLQKKLGFRYLMDVIPTTAEMVRGSHGLPAASVGEAPVFMTTRAEFAPSAPIEPVGICQILLDHLFGQRGKRQ